MKYAPLAIVVIIVILGGYVWWHFQSADSTLAPAINTSPLSSSLPSTTAEVMVTSPVSGAAITSPVTITGQALGSWYFEAVFPIEVRDAQNMVIGHGQAQALSDWTTTDFVPFSATVVFVKPANGGAGSIVLHNDNPSGLAENEKSLSVPVIFH